MTNQRIRVFVTGKVQGVFFRQALKSKQNKTMFLVGLEISKMAELKPYLKAQMKM